MAHRKTAQKTSPDSLASYGRQTIYESDVRAVTRVLSSRFLTQGPTVPEFEERLAASCSTSYAVAAINGTAALYLAYRAVGIGAGDEVITTPNTFVATTNMLLAVGAKPVFCDIRLDTYNIDESQIKKHITKRTKAITAVHFAGNPCAMDVIRKIARTHELLIIEDATHALGAEFKNKKIGPMGDAAIFSFHPVKPITTGEGGAIVTNNRSLYEKAILLRNHGITKNKVGENIMTELGFNHRMNDIQAALGISQLQKVDFFIKKRRTIAQWYSDMLSGITGIFLPNETPAARSGWHLYVIRTKDQKVRDALAKYLKEHGVETAFHYPAVYSHPYYRTHGYSQTALPNMDTYHQTALTLPIHPQMKKGDVQYVAKAIRSFFHAD